MKPTRVFAFLAVLSVVLMACGTQNNTGTGSTAAFIGGSTGMVIDFQEGSPPPEVTDDGSYSFFAMVRLENRGEWPLSAGDIKVSLEGFLPSDFGVAESQLRNKNPRDNLEPKRRDPNGNMVEGTTTFITFPSEDQALVPKKFAGNVQVPFRAEMCYYYGTNAQANVCILQDLLNKQKNPVCDPNAGKGVMSSSSPVQISGFRQAVVGKDKISFSFDVVHSGSGSIYRVDNGRARADCPFDARDMRVNEDLVKVTVTAEGLNSITCNLDGGSSTTGYVKLISGRRPVTCTVDLTNQHTSNFEKIVDIKAEFNYKESKDTKVLVKHLI
jgi:hypothetical protein